VLLDLRLVDERSVGCAGVVAKEEPKGPGVDAPKRPPPAGAALWEEKPGYVVVVVVAVEDWKAVPGVF